MVHSRDALIPTGAVVLISALLAACVPEERAAPAERTVESAPPIPAHWPPHIREHWETHHSGKATPTPSQAQDGYGADEIGGMDPNV